MFPKKILPVFVLWNLIGSVNFILVPFLQFPQKIHSDSAQNPIDLLPTSRSIPRMKNFQTKSLQKSFKVTKKFKTYMYHFIVQLINYLTGQTGTPYVQVQQALLIETNISAFIFNYQIQ